MDYVFEIKNYKKKYLFIIILLFQLFVGHAQDIKFKIKSLLDYQHHSYIENLKQIDSAIYLAEKFNENSMLGESYFTKAAYVYKKREYNEALKYFIKANKASKNIDNYIYYSSLFGIASIKQQLEDYKECIEILKKCLNYFKNNSQHYKNNTAYSVTLDRLTYINAKIGEISKAEDYSKLEFENATSKNDSAYAFKNLGILDYKRGNFNTAIENLNKAQLLIKANNDKSWLMSILHFKGESYSALGNTKQANQHYLEVIQEFKNSKIINNDIRMSFERLLNYYKKINDKENELKTINQLLKYDSLFFATNQKIARSYFKDYENSNLIDQHEKLSNDMMYSKTIIISLVFISIVIIVFIISKNRIEKQKLLKYINTISNEKFNKTQIKQNTIVEFEESFEERLKIFTDNLTFLNPNFTLDDLGVLIGTNRSIASKYINQTRNVNFNQYINSLRIDYIVEELINDPKIRLLTIDAIADKAGFKSRKTFSDAFLKHTGFRPSYFVKNIEE